MPRSLIVLCLTNLFCWASLVCYSLYFTDFVGQSVYHGDPTADAGTASHGRYETGVRAGAVGMALYSASCSFYSLNIEKLVRSFGETRTEDNTMLLLVWYCNRSGYVCVSVGQNNF